MMEQLEGQIASAKISMAKLSSAQLYYVLQEMTLHPTSTTKQKHHLPRIK